MSTIHTIELVLYKTYAELKVEASETYLSFLWWIIEPVLYMAVFYVVFGLILRRGGGVDYIPFLLCGLTVWKWFASTVQSGANAIRANAGLMRQVYIPKIIFPTTTILQNTVKFAIILALLVIFLQIIGKGVTVTYIVLPVLILAQLLLIAACTYILSAVVPFAPDITQLIGNGMMMLMFLSGIFYSGDKIPEAYQPYFYLNPMASLIQAYRDVMLYSQWPDWSAVGWIAITSIGAIWFSFCLFSRFDRVYPRLIG